MTHKSRKKPAIPFTGLGVLFTAVIILVIAQAACDEELGSGGSRTVTETVSGDWIRVYFTSPRYPDDDAYHYAGLDEELASVIEQAETSVDLVAYDFDLARVADALIAAYSDGVQVRVVVESDNADEQAVADLRQAGVPLVEDERTSGLMHNKFAVIDGQWVWTGYPFLYCPNLSTPTLLVIAVGLGPEPLLAA
jgi:phosphatidylserine/phosphatidylglycerophosphate/cardiolipin synthase-like enzyme